MKWKNRGIFFIILCICLGILPLLSANVYADNKKTVKIGYYYSHNFQEGAGDNEVKSGYSYEYLQKLASYTGWNYEYVYGEWGDLFQKLVSGEIDMMAGISYSEERTKLIRYPDQEMLNETFYIYKDVDDESIECGNIESYKNKKIGALKNDQRMSRMLEQWKAENHAQISIQYYEDLTACAEAFNKKQIDGFVSADNMVSSYTNIVPVEKIGKVPYYICVAKNRKDILNELNMAMNIVDEQDALDLDELRNKYFTETTVSVFLSEQERAWMEEHDTVTVGYLDNYLPYCDTGSDGKATGLIADIVPDLFAGLPGDYKPKIIYKKFDDQLKMMNSLKAGDVDFIFPVSDGRWYSEQEGYLQSSSVVAFPVAMIYKEPYSNSIADKIVVNRKNLRQYWYTIANYPEAEVIMCDSIEACIKAVDSGEVNSTLVSALRAGHLIGNEKDLNMITLADDEKICFGVGIDDNALLQIVNHGIAILGDSYGLNHTYRYLDSMSTFTFTDFMQENIWTCACVILLAVLLIIFYFIRREQKQQKAAEKEQQQKELLEEALVASQQAALARKVFLRNMSHDIRTPMNAVIGFTRLGMQAGDDIEKVREYLSKILVSSNHLLGIVNEVLEISRIESGQTKLEEIPCSLKAIADETDIIIREQALEKKQIYTVDMFGIQNEYVLCDKLRVKEILVNLLGNAVKYTPEGGKISLKICQTFSQDPKYGNYEMHVKDNGCGMNEEFLQKLFEPFERQQNFTVSGIQGTGLGMTIVKNFVDMMDGTIDVKSQENKGTEITVKLRFALTDQVAEAKKQENVAGYMTAKFAGKRLLLCEDNGLNREIAASVLRQAGFLVETAENGQEAVDKVKASEGGYYDAVLMDIQMPVMDGYTATKEIRKMEDKILAEIPIIAISANAFDEDRKSSYEAGMDGHLAKPIDVDELLEMLGNML